MTEARLSCGGCGFELVIRAQGDADGRVALQVEGGCEQVQRLVSSLSPFDPLADGRTLFATSVYQAADAALKHVDCAVPMALVRAVQVEAGLALPHTVTLTVERR